MDLITGLTAVSVGALFYTVKYGADLARSRPRRVAHESGHALLMWRSPYIHCERATIVSNLMGTDGHCMGLNQKRETVGSVIDSAVVYMGGLAGEAVAHGFYEIGGGSSDIKRGRAELRKILGASPPTLRQAFALAQKRIGDDRRAFDKLRSALDAHDTLEAPQIRAILGPQR